MKKRVFRIIAALLCICLVVPGILGTTVSADTAEEYLTTPDENGCYTYCKGNCEHTPSIIIHGIGQSNTYLADEDGNPVKDDDGKTITGWPLYIDVNYAIKELLFPLLFSVIFQRDCGLIDKIPDVVAELFKWNSFDENGDNVYNIVVEKYPYSVARCNDYEKNEIYGNIPLNDYSAIAGEDHLYYFAYNSFGNNVDICAELTEFIEMVKKETGHDKVNLVPISLGGTIANGLLEYYPDTYKSLDRVVYIIPALNGSNLLGDIFKGEFSTSPEMAYEVMFPMLLEDATMGNLINILIRIVPYDLLCDIVYTILDSLVRDVLINCTTMWSLIPKEDFIYCRDKYYAGINNSEVRKEIDMYYQAQCNSLANIQKLVDNGVEVFDIVDYSYPLYCIVPSWDEVNADGIIQIESTGMGIESCYVDEQFPADYVQKNVNALGGNNCSDPSHDHIPDDREIDASTCLLPDHTFFFYKADHEGTGRNDVVMKLATALLADHQITDVYSNPNFPQFNVGRETKWLRNTLKEAKNIDRSTLSAEDAAQLQAAIDATDAYLNNTVVKLGEQEIIENQLDAALVQIGYKEAPENETVNTIFGYILKGINDLLNKTLGYKSFT